MRVHEVMTEHPVCCLPATPVARVARLMAENGCGAIPVVRGEDERTPIGLISDRDIAVRTVAEGRDPLEMLAGDIRPALPGTIGEEASLQECASLMQELKVRCLIVTDARGWVSGIVSQSQIVRHLPRSHPSTSTGGNGP